jgi:hypothetical protein
MMRLIVTANDQLYERLSEAARVEGETPQRARTVLQGFKRATVLSALAEGAPATSRAGDPLSSIVVDMALVAADTLIEALHSRPSTAPIPLLAVQCDAHPLPLSLRRLCVKVLPAEAIPSATEPPLGDNSTSSEEWMVGNR